MKNSLLRNITMAVKICIVAFCFLNVEKTFAQVFEYQTFYQDKDGDGFGNINVTCIGGEDWGFCDQTTRWVENAEDCNDLDRAINPNTVWYKDLDNDGLTTWETLTQCTRPAGYKLINELYFYGKGSSHTCQKNNLIVIQSLSNTIDNDDAFFIDPAIIFNSGLSIWFVDNDKDGFVQTKQYVFSYGIPLGDKNYKGFRQSNSLITSLPSVCEAKIDCNDNNPLMHAIEEWYWDGDGDGFPLTTTPVYIQCSPPQGDFFKIKEQLKSVEFEDCDDTDDKLYPEVWYEDKDGDGLSTGKATIACGKPDGYISLPGGPSLIDCDDTDPNATIEQEWYADSDGDGYGDGVPRARACTRPAGLFTITELLSMIDCNDNNGAVHPGATEFCNGIDDDCDGLIDETYCCPTSSIIYVNAANTGTQNGNSWATAFKYLQDALEVARRCNTVTQIWVTGGSYYPDEGGIVNNSFQPRGGLAIYGGFVGTETLLSQRTLSAPPSILSGEVQQDFNQFNNYTNLMVLDNINTPFVLDGFTIQDGYSNIVVPLNKGRGVGLLVLNSTSAVQIRNCTFKNNVGNYGAAIANVSSMPEYINCVITGNTTMIGNGAIWNDNASPRFVNCSIADNAITGSDFIIIRNTGSAFPIIINSIVRGTSPAMDGGSPLVAFSYIQNESLWPGIGNINSDPLFVDEANGNLRLQPGSPAINAGAYNLAPINYTIINNEQTDIEGKPRIIFQIDMGAYEDPVQPVLCSPISLTNSVLQALQFNGCGTGDIGSTTFPYSPTPAALTSSEYTSLNLPVAEGSCDIAAVKYADVIDQALSLPGKVVVVRTFTVTDVSGAVATATQQIKVVDAAAPTVLTKNITAQLGAGGSVTITAAQINNGSFDACGVQSYSLDKTTFFCSNRGNNTVTLTVTDVNGNIASGTASVTVVDMVKPTVLTKNITVQLEPGGIATITPQQVDNGSFDACGVVLYSLNKTTFDCNNVGANTVTLTVKDANANTASGTATVTVVDNVKPIVLTKNLTVELEPGGIATISLEQVDNGSYDPCGLVSYSLDKTVFYCNNVGANIVTLTVEDANGNTATGTATVTVVDNVKPIVLTKNITVQLLPGGTATIFPAQVDNGSYDPCGLVLYSLNKTTFNCSNVGANTVTLTVKDANGNTASANATVTVEDHVAPTMLTKNITVQLTAGGNVTITAAQVDNGSFDACGIVNYSLSKSTFLCSNVGANTVKLTATDANGNTATANATVTVEDHVAPTMLTKNITVQLTAGGNVTITGVQVDNGSFDACGIQTFSLSKSTFLCSNVGANTVKLTATDANGNTASANATVTVEDHVAPTMLTKNITVQLTAGGNVTITAAQVNNGSFDACGIQTLSLNKTTFLCSDIGANTVKLTATDANGNTATANATVTVEDHVAPTMLTKNITVQLTAVGSVTITPAQVDNGSFDACGIQAYSLSKNTFDCSNVGANTIALKATDANGNTATASAVVTVEDKIKPVITSCPTVPVQCYNANGVYTIPALTATDNCGISSISFVISGATSRNGNSNASGTFNPGTSTISWKVTDVNSNTATCTTTVKIDKVDATIADAYASGISSLIGSPNTIYIGYGGSSVTLTAQVTSSLSPNTYVYKWTTGSPAGPGFANTQSITVTPSATTTYFVSIKDANGCGPLVQVSKQIQVVDIRCGNNKINVCQFKNGSYSTACVSSSPKTINGLQAGSYLGACVQALTSSEIITETSSKIIPEENIAENFQVRVMPNPSSTNFRIVVNSNDLKAPVKLLVTDMLGRVIETRITNAGQTITIGDKYISGTYAVRILQGRKTKQLTLIKLSD